MSINTDIVICGAGPVGLTLALALQQYGVDCTIIDKLVHRQPYCKALGITPKTLELFDSLGIVQEIIAPGLWFERMTQYKNGEEILSVNVQSSELPYGFLSLPQYKLEEILMQQLRAHGVLIETGIELKHYQQDKDGVLVDVVNLATKKTSQIHCRYLIGCDGEHSIVRKLSNIDFCGDKLPEQYMLADVQVDWSFSHTTNYRFSSDAQGVENTLIFVPYREPKRFRISCKLPEEFSEEHSIQNPQALFDSLVKTTVPVPCRLSDLRWFSKYSISHRIVNQYRHQRIFLAGDSAHIHPPVGGQGMNTGIQDAYNLAWKLAFRLQNQATDALLDTYQQERQAVGNDVVHRTYQRLIHAQQNQQLDVSQIALLQDTQLFIHYRNSPLNQKVVEDSKSLQGGDRAPDADGLLLQGVNFYRRLHDLMRGPDFKCVLYIDQPISTEQLIKLFEQKFVLPAQYLQPPSNTIRHRLVICSKKGLLSDDAPAIIAVDDSGQFKQTWQPKSFQAWVIRPDHYLLSSHE